MNSKAFFVVFACTLAACGAGTAPTTVAPARRHLHPAPVRVHPTGIPELKTARCGRLTVPEDRHRPNGRKITLAVAIVPANRRVGRATRSSGLRAALEMTQSSRSRWRWAGKLNANRNVIFMSQRGTYTADPKLTCARWIAGLPRH